MATTVKDIWQILLYMKRTVPLAVLLCSFMLEHHGFTQPCDSDASNSIVACYAVLSVIDFGWTFLMASDTFRRYYPNDRKKWIVYSWIQACVSVLDFIAIVYFTNNGFPLSCVHPPYDPTTARALFYMAFVVTAFVAYIEHYVWRKLPSQEFTNELESNNLNNEQQQVP